MTEEQLRTENEELRRKLDEAEQTLRALVSDELDTVARADGATPILLRAAQEQLRANEQLLRAVFDGALDAMLIADNEGRYVDANPAACEVFGCTRETLIGRRISEFSASADRLSTTWPTFLATGRMRGDFPIVRPDGARRDLEYSAVANVLPGLHLSVVRDVTERIAAERALRSTEERLRTVISHAAIILYAIDKQGIYTLHEGKGVESLGLRPGEIVGQSAFAQHRDTKGAEESIRRALAGEEVRDSYETRGKVFDCTLVPVRDEHGEITGITGVAMDVTSRRSAEVALRASEARFRALIEESHDGTSLVDAKAEILYVSPSISRMLGVTPAEALGKTVHDFVHPDDRELFERHMRQVLADPSATVTSELRKVHRDGSVRWIEMTSRNRIAEAAIGAVVNNFRDVSERKAAHVALVEGRRLLEEAQAIAHLGSWRSDGALDAPVAWSTECARIFGRDASESPTLGEFLHCVHPEDRERVVAEGRRATEEQRPCVTEHRIVRPDGEIRWVYARAIDPRNRMVGVVQDITERRRAADELRASDLRYRRIVENTSEGVWVYDENGTTTFMNARMAQMLRCTVDDAVGTPIFRFMDDSMNAEARAWLARRKRGESARGEFRLRRSDGTDLYISVHADALLDASGKFEASLALVTDISDRRQTEEMKNLLASIVESSQDAIMSRDVNGVIRTWNRGAEKLTQYSAAEMVGATSSLLYPPADFERLEACRASVAAGHAAGPLELQMVRKDGSRLDVMVTTSVLRDEQGTITGGASIVRDITARKRAESALRRSEEQLRQAQKMEAIGSLAGGVAHDFNNLLSVILSYTTLILDDLSPGDPLRSDIQEVQRAGMRATALTRQLLAFSRKQILQPVVVDVNQVVQNVEKMLGRVLGEDVELGTVLNASGARIYADPGQVEQVIINLVVNSRDAMPNGGNVTIETANVMLEESHTAALADVSPGAYVMIAVTDTGEGMDAATKERIFEPFFTTKEKSKGTGLGLSTVYGIAQQSGGHIRVYSEPGRGTTMKVYFPLTERALVASVAPPPVASPHGGNETILLVEDEEQVRVIMRSILRKHGYHVLEAQNGGEAFLLCEQFATKIDLLLTDVVMPRMSGRQLSERLLKLRPAMKVLFVSGYTENTIVHHGVLDAGIEFLAKPIMPDALVRKVRQVLDTPSSG